MYEIANSEATFVSRLRLTHAGRDPLAARMRVASLLASAELRPAWLSRSAVVCVKRLRDPMPGALASRAATARVPEVWRRAVVASIEELIRGAARPAREAVPASAECVLFEDRAELLACMARDLCEGSLAARWWWGGILEGAGGRARALVRSWVASSEYAPAALSLLARGGRASDFARAITPSEARELLESVARRFALADLLDASAHAPHARAMVNESPREPARSEGAGEAQAPWRVFAPEAEASGREVERRMFVGVCLSIERAPAAVRSREFARSAARWLAAASREERGREAGEKKERATVQEHALTHSGAAPEVSFAGEGDEARRVDASERRGTRAPRARGGDVAGGAVVEDEEVAEGKSANAHVERAGRERVEVAASPSVSAEESVASPRDADARDAGGAEFRDVESKRRGESQEMTEGAAEVFEATNDTTPLVEEARRDEWPETQPLVERKIETELGGLFFLINVGLSLNLYGDFTSPRAPCLSLVMWDFVELLGRALAGAGADEEDAAWGLLARLAGRGEGERPGVGFEPPEEWRVPAEWLAPFRGARDLSWSAEGGRLRVEHPAGFLVVDVPLDGGDAPAQLEHEMEAYGITARADAGGSTRSSEEAGEAGRADALRRALRIDGAQARWLARLVPYVRARLRLALGTDDADEAARLVLSQRARVLVTAARVDVHFSLDAFPVEVRMSGLDRDPGWLPSAGRHVFFHFD